MSRLKTRLAPRVGSAAALAAFLSLGSVAAQNSGQTEAPHQSVTPDVPTAVILSNRDTNRVVCVAGQIDGYRFSEEKGALVDGTGSEAFIKFLIERLGEEQKYVTQRSEFYFQCGGVTYTILSAPSNIAAQTVYLVPGSGAEAKENRLRFKALSEEERAVSMSLDLLKDDVPASFHVRSVNEPYDRYTLNRLDVRLVREVEVVGTIYRAREYLLRARSDVVLNERDFLKPTFGTSIYAVTFERLKLKAGEVGRVVLVYRGEQS